MTDARSGAGIWDLLPRSQRIMLIGLAALLILVQIDQPFLAVAWRYHVPTAGALAASLWLLNRWPLSTASLGCIVLFLALHTIGGRWCYVFVPYDDVARWFTGSTISEAFGFTRNHYDRLVHFSYGLLAIPPVREVLIRHIKLSPRIALYFAFESVLAVSALFEIWEWLVSIAGAGAAPDGLNGRQGDMWDPQKDMALAALGGVAMSVIQLWTGNDTPQTRTSERNSASATIPTVERALREDEP